MKTKAILLLTAATGALAAGADETGHRINAFGLELHQRIVAEAPGNAVFSPWSIQSALGMTYAGANGVTREDMANVLHFGKDEDAVHRGFAGLNAALLGIVEDSAIRIEEAEQDGGNNRPLEINIANSLFGQQGYPFEQAFLETLQLTYEAPLQLMNFATGADASRLSINEWAEQNTQGRIKDLLPDGSIDGLTRLVLANAVYFNAPWRNSFSDGETFEFAVDGTDQTSVPMLESTASFGHMDIPGGTAITVPYADEGIHLLILLPDEDSSLAEFEKQLIPGILDQAAKAPEARIRLRMPSFKIEPGALELSDHLAAMGMPSAFGDGADFSRMSPNAMADQLSISSVVHQAFVAVDKYGTEAAAATAVVMQARSLPPRPVEVRIDRPFVFAIQHTDSAACLFLGRITDPR